MSTGIIYYPSIPIQLPPRNRASAVHTKTVHVSGRGYAPTPSCAVKRAHGQLKQRQQGRSNGRDRILVPLQRPHHGLPFLDVPDPDRLVARTRDNSLAVWGQSNGRDRILVPLQRSHHSL